MKTLLAFVTLSATLAAASNPAAGASETAAVAKRASRPGATRYFASATLPEGYRQQAPGVTRDTGGLALWWKQLKDAELDSLIDRAVKGNIDLRIAAARVAQARALEKAQRSTLF